jgi:uncharacterized membrane protein
MAWLAAAVLLIAASLVSPIRTTPLRVQERQTWPALQGTSAGLSLDGSEFIKVAYPGDYAAIQWINQHIGGSPVMLQSRYGNYRNCSARITMFTRLPTVVDWGFEDAQQRYNGQLAPNGLSYPLEVATREADVDTIYSTTDAALALTLLHQYHVQYIYVGVQERGDPFLRSDPTAFHGYPAAGLAKFSLMTAAGDLRLVYNHLGVQIYQVVR